MKRTVVIIICTAAAFLITGAASAVVNNKPVKNPTTTSSASSVMQNYYIVREYNGKLAVFKNSDKYPTTIYDVFVFTFPEADKELLKKGIKVTSEHDLRKLIEDYTS